MKLINPNEISAKIITLIDETEGRLIIVSPYMKISKWYKLANKINEMRNRGIIPEIYVRDDVENTATYRDLELLDLPYKKLPHLHSKLYMNDSSAIVTSMNLLLSSEFNSLEIGYATENLVDYNDLFEYYLRYIQKGETIHQKKFAGGTLLETKELLQKIREKSSKTATNLWPMQKKNTIHISTGKDNYRVKISEGHLWITVRKKIYVGKNHKGDIETLPIAQKIGDLTKMKIHMFPNTVLPFLQYTGEVLYTLKSPCITGILKEESALILDSIVNFIDASENLDATEHFEL